jgi:replication-associated recombination protein RarA
VSREIPPTRRGYRFDEANSALQKCVRRGDEAGAAFFAIELHESGFHDHVWRRLRLICSEDCGLAWPMGPAVVHALHESWADARKHDRTGGLMFVVHAALALARAPKSRIVNNALIVLASGPDLPVPDVALDRHTKRGREMGRGRQHFAEEASLVADVETGELGHEPHLPDPYRERAVAAGQRRREPEPEGQMTIEEER